MKKSVIVAIVLIVLLLSILSSAKENIKIKMALSGEDKEIKNKNAKFKIKAKQMDIDARFYIADNDQILFIISKGNMPDEEIAVWLNTPFFTSALAFLFEEAVK